VWQTDDEYIAERTDRLRKRTVNVQKENSTVETVELQYKYRLVRRERVLSWLLAEQQLWCSSLGTNEEGDLCAMYCRVSC
jgi:hypothetical protein